MRRSRCTLSEAEVRRCIGDDTVDCILERTAAGVYATNNSSAWCIVKNVSLHGKTVATRHGTFSDRNVARVAADWLQQQPKSIHMRAGAARQWVQSECRRAEDDQSCSDEPQHPEHSAESDIDAVLQALDNIIEKSQLQFYTDHLRALQLTRECSQKLQIIERILAL